jgi:hypothetical protein
MSQCTPSTTIKGRRKEGRERKKMDKIETSKKKKSCCVLVAHTYNPSYSGGRD